MSSQGLTPSELVGGILASADLLSQVRSAEEAKSWLDALWHGPAAWHPVLRLSDGPGTDGRLRLDPRWVVGWTEPDPVLVAAHSDILESAWHPTDSAPDSELGRSSIRLRVRDIGAYERLRNTSTGGWQVVPHGELPGNPFTWRWPLRVAVLGQRVDVRVVEGGYWTARLCELVAAPPDAEVEIAVVHAAELHRLAGIQTALAVVLDVRTDGFAPQALLDKFSSLGVAAAWLVPGQPSGLMEELVVRLSHDQPLDIATAELVPDGVLLASNEFLPYTSIRAWAAGLGRDLAHDEPNVGGLLQGLARGGFFDHESGGAGEIVQLVGRVPGSELARLTHFVPPVGHVIDEGPRWLDGEDAEGSPFESIDDETPPPGPDLRRLQVEVKDGSGRVRADAFVAGERHRLRVRIAAAQAGNLLVAPKVFTSPTPGQPVTLTIVVALRNSEQVATHSLMLPAYADSEWTDAISLDIPGDETKATVDVVVLYQGRALQTVSFTRPVVETGEPIRSALPQLSVDADTPLGDLDSRTRGHAALVLTPSLGEVPTVLDLTAIARPIPARRVQDGLDRMRQQLLGAFTAPPADLAGAGPLLAQVARAGSTLRDALRGSEHTFHDDDPWIHVSTFGGDLPFEVIYTHPRPASNIVPVCGPALAGETECRMDCADRNRKDVVCPYAFWGTSKVIERRWHTPDRRGRTPPARRRITIAAGAVVSTSVITDQTDPTASERIRSAVSGFVGVDRMRAVSGWTEWQAAVAASASPLLVLVTHTVKADQQDPDAEVRLELGGIELEAGSIDETYVNPVGSEPGPVVLSLGCDTNDLPIGYNDWVGHLHAAGAEVVVSTLSPVPGRKVADFVGRAFAQLPQQLSAPGPHRWGALLTEVRKATIAQGDPLALTITAWGDGDVELV